MVLLTVDARNRSGGVVAQCELCTRWDVTSCYESDVGLVHLGMTVETQFLYIDRSKGGILTSGIVS